MEQIIRKIRTDLRLSMNGITAASMRDKGVNYRMNFGVDVTKLKHISNSYSQDRLLAERLWEEDVRELKILATMLYPKAEFAKEAADRWVKDIEIQEIREQACKNLFQELPYAPLLVQEWLQSDKENIRTTGYWLFARLCIIGSELTDKISAEDLLTNAALDIKNESILLRQAALNALKFYGRASKQRAAEVMKRVAAFENSTVPGEKEIFDSLRFEFEFAD